MKFLKNFLFVVLLNITPNSVFTNDISLENEELLKTLPPDQRASIMSKMSKAESLNEEIEDAFEDESILIKRPEIDEEDEDLPKCKSKECIYGYSLFRYSPTTFAPANQIPISSTYTLGPGDTLEIVLYGSKEKETKAVVSRDGKISIPFLGPVQVAGMTYSEASDMLSERIETELIGTQLSISITELRSINIYLLGEAYRPGAYTVSALSSITNVLFVSGGTSELGSLRNIEVKRKGQTIHVYDFYDLLLKGNTQNEFKLEDGDTIFIPFIENRVLVEGAFRRPFFYEIKKGETLTDAIFLAGGLQSSVLSKDKIEVNTVDRNTGQRNIQLFSRDENYLLQDGDIITTSGNTGYTPEVILLSGEVRKPGAYSISQGETILDIIDRAGGYTDRSFSEGAIFTRVQVAEQQKAAFQRSADTLENTLVNIVSSGTIDNIDEFTLTPISTLIQKLREAEPIGRQVVELDYLKLRTDPYANFMVRGGDEIFIPRRPESIVVTGEVLNPSTLRYFPGSSFQEYLNMAGGLNDQADKDRVFVVFPNGQAKLLQKTLFNSGSEILPGSTIVASRDSRPFDAVQLTQIVTPILADLATSAAAIAAISDN